MRSTDTSLPQPSLISLWSVTTATLRIPLVSRLSLLISSSSAPFWITKHILGLRGGDTWSEEGNEDQLMLRWGIGAVLHHATPDVTDLPVQYSHFAKQLWPTDCVVTFNYDRV